MLYLRRAGRSTSQFCVEHRHEHTATVSRSAAANRRCRPTRVESSVSEIMYRWFFVLLLPAVTIAVPR